MSPTSSPAVPSCGSDREMLEALERATFAYFAPDLDPDRGLVPDRNQPGSPASIAATGMGLSAYAVAVDRGFLSRHTAITRALCTLRFFHASHQGPEPDATGYKGFYYHFLDMKTGRRAWESELSTIDTALLLAGVLTVGLYFDGASAEEQEIRALADALYRRVDWRWALNGKSTLSHGWSPERGFLQYSWDCGYSEALILYVLALGSPTFPIPEAGYRDWTRTFEQKTVYGIEYLYAGPLFIHQFPQLWLDLRGLYDDRNREIDCDYFENSRRATLVHQQYGIRNPAGFAGYSANGWGLTASDGPGPAVREINGVRREFYGYLARGAPFGPDDGTISPWAVVASLPFAPEVVCEVIHHALAALARRHLTVTGFDASYNGTFPDPAGGAAMWASPWKFGLNEGPMVLMIENHLSGLLWRLFRRSAVVVDGLRRAGFRGGWLTR